MIKNNPVHVQWNRYLYKPCKSDTFHGRWLKLYAWSKHFTNLNTNDLAGCTFFPQLVRFYCTIVCSTWTSVAVSQQVFFCHDNYIHPSPTHDNMVKSIYPATQSVHNWPYPLEFPIPIVYICILYDYSSSTTHLKSKWWAPPSMRIGITESGTTDLGVT